MAEHNFHPSFVTALELGGFEVAADFQEYVTFASGAGANNKLTADLALEPGRSPEVRAAVVRPMAQLILNAPFHPRQGRRTVLYGIPNGGQAFAEGIGEELELDVVRLVKDVNGQGNKTYRPVSQSDLELLHESDDAIAVEDAGNRWTSLHGAMYGSREAGLGELAVKTRGVAIFLQRSQPSLVRSLGRPVRVLTYLPIPDVIGPQDRAFQRLRPWISWREPDVA